MFIEIEKKRIEFPFGKTTLWFRFDNRAFLNIEKSGFNPFDTRILSENAAAARVFITEGLRGCLAELGVSCKAADITNSLMKDEKESVITLIQLAVLTALPSDTGGAKNGGGKGHAGTLLSVFCDIMHRSEEEFWSATLREVTERWERYAILKGYKKSPLQIKEFDD